MDKKLQKSRAFCDFSPNFQSENSFELTKDRRIEMRGPQPCIEKMSPLPLLLMLLIELFIRLVPLTFFDVCMNVYCVSLVTCI